MKEFKLWVKVLFLLVFVAICYFVVNSILQKKADVDYDFTNYAYNNVFYMDFKQVYDPATKTTISPKFENTGAGLTIIVIDEELNPIPNSTIKFYDNDKFYIATIKTNESGIIALNNLPMDYVLNFKQQDTREGLNIDNTPYVLTLDKVGQFKQIIVNSDKELTDEQVTTIEAKYKEEHQPKKSLEDNLEQIPENGIRYDYKFINEELLGYRIVVTEVPENNVKKGETQYKCARFSIQIPGAEIKKIELISQQDRKDRTQTLDTNLKERTVFENGEDFRLIYKSKTWNDNIFYNAKITFKINDKTYSVCKRDILKTK